MLLAGSLCLLPFLLPYHQQPVLSFFPEWLAMALGVAATLVFLAGRNASVVSWPALARWLLVFALFLGVTAVHGEHAYFQLPLVAMLYVLYAVLVIWLGAQLAIAFGVERVAMVLAAFLLAGALANAASGVIQFYGRPDLFEDVIAELHGSRAYGNIAQPNLYANYLALGEGALVLLWLRERVRTGYALLALVLLVLGSALSGSRSALLYALWYSALGLLAVRVEDNAAARRLRFGACVVAGAALLAHLVVPWFNNLFDFGPSGGGMLDRTLVEHGETRWQAWLIALRLFVGAPMVGVGFGEFAGAAFESGLDPSLTRSGEVWTSPHNLPLQLLAETGVVGTILVIGGLCLWGWQAIQRYRANPQPNLWWILSAAGIELIHSLIEFPMWSAHFLGVAALMMGAGATPASRPPAMSHLSRISASAACAALAMVWGIMLRDYLRLDTARITGTSILTLTPTVQAQRDAATMRDLTHGLMAPLAEFWIIIGAPLDRSKLAEKLVMSERVARVLPANAVVVRRAVFLAFDGQAEKATALLARALRTFPRRLDATISILEQGRVADPSAIEPLLAMARAAPALLE
ncbi:MAG TPA: Wzy polymerase domain-containing protein [Burkholderiales bacterium]